MWTLLFLCLSCFFSTFAQDEELVYCSIKFVNSNVHQLIQALYINANETCTYVDGFIDMNLIVNNDTLPSFQRLMALLDKVQIVTDYVTVTIDFTQPASFSMKSLKAIYGDQLYAMNGGQYALLFKRNERELHHIHFPSLSVIARGNIGFIENGNFANAETLLLWREYMEDSSNQQFVYEDLKNGKAVSTEVSQCQQCPNCEAVAPVEGKCSVKCAAVKNQQKFCFGNKTEQCQWTNKCDSNELFTWCYYNATAQSKSACHKECIGGCSCGGPNQCTACRHFYYKTVCLEVCPANTFRLSRLCLEKCPSDYEPQNGVCIKGAILPVINCSLLDENKNHLILTKSRLSSLCGCFTLDGSILVNHLSFRSEDMLADPKEFDCLKSLQIVSGIVYFDFLTAPASIRSDPDVNSLKFLNNLEVIQGVYVGINPLVSFTLANSNAAFVHLKSLRFINGKLYFNKNPNLKYANTIKWQALGATSLTVRNSNPKNGTCASNCDNSLGCWGPSDVQCVTCSTDATINRDQCGKV